MTGYRYSYTGPLDLYDFGRYAYHVLYAPPELQAELLAQQRPRVRISGEAVIRRQARRPLAQSSSPGC